MPNPHRIRLQGPWEITWQAGEAPPVTKTQTPPLDLREWETLGTDRSGIATIIFKRRFHAPTNITAADALVIQAEGVHGSGVCQLNQVALLPFVADGTTVVIPLPYPLPRFNELAFVFNFRFDDRAEVGDAGAVVESSLPAMTAVSLMIHASD